MVQEDADVYLTGGYGHFSCSKCQKRAWMVRNHKTSSMYYGRCLDHARLTADEALDLIATEVKMPFEDIAMKNIRDILIAANKGEG